MESVQQWFRTFERATLLQVCTQPDTFEVAQVRTSGPSGYLHVAEAVEGTLAFQRIGIFLPGGRRSTGCFLVGIPDGFVLSCDGGHDVQATVGIDILAVADGDAGSFRPSHFEADDTGKVLPHIEHKFSAPCLSHPHGVNDFPDSDRRLHLGGQLTCGRILHADSRFPYFGIFWVGG